MSIAARWQDLRDEVRDVCSVSGRDASGVEIVAVSKGHGACALRGAHEAGARAFGESYFQDWRTKWALGDELNGLRWHWVGRLQSNKLRDVAQRAHVVHSVSRAKEARELVRHGFNGEAFVQVNISGEATKGGVAPDELEEFISGVLDHGLAVRGLMGMAPLGGGREGAQRAFARLRSHRDALMGVHPQVRDLSMGMSGDWDLAVREGATHIRVGTRLFGPREG